LAKDLISKLLVVNPYERLDGEGIMSHPWIKGEGTPRKKLPCVLGEMVKFNARRKLKRATSAVLGAIRLKNLMQKGKTQNPGTSKMLLPPQLLMQEQNNFF
jgi:hypothetical protein